MLNSLRLATEASPSRSSVTSRSARRADDLCVDLEEKMVERAPKTFLRMDFFLRLGERTQWITFRKNTNPTFCLAR